MEHGSLHVVLKLTQQKLGIKFFKA